jgi:glycosyltransferase involved in cell wall biosynthesis
MVSIVIPVYNRPQKILDAFRSVQSQSYSNWELIVIDDASTDNTQQIVRQFISDDSRVRLMIHDKNRGAQAARNTGIKAARGEWIAFLDSDDLWLPESLKLRLEVAEKDRVSVVHSACLVTSADGQTTPYDLPPTRGPAYTEMLRHEGPMFQSLLVSKEALQRIGYLDEKLVSFQEWDTAIRLAKYFPFGYEPRPTFIYNDRHTDPTSRISKSAVHQAEGYHYIIRKHLLAILLWAGPSSLRAHYATAEALYWKAGDGMRARWCGLVSFACECFLRFSNKFQRAFFAK